MIRFLSALLLVAAFCAPLRAQISATQVYELNVASTVTAGEFSGDGYNITGITIGVSSVAAGPYDIASTDYVDLSTATITLRGNRLGAVIYTVNLDNQSANQRDYTIQLTGNGTTLDENVTTIRANDLGQAGDMYLLTPSSTGENNFALNIKADGTVGTQLANDVKIRVIEW